jgi:hypothetical protein
LLGASCLLLGFVAGVVVTAFCLSRGFRLALARLFCAEFAEPPARGNPPRRRAAGLRPIFLPPDGDS